MGEPNSSPSHLTATYDRGSRQLTYHWVGNDWQRFSEFFTPGRGGIANLKAAVRRGVRRVAWRHIVSVEIGQPQPSGHVRDLIVGAVSERDLERIHQAAFNEIRLASRNSAITCAPLEIVGKQPALVRPLPSADRASTARPYARKQLVVSLVLAVIGTVGTVLLLSLTPLLALVYGGLAFLTVFFVVYSFTELFFTREPRTERSDHVPH